MTLSAGRRGAAGLCSAIVASCIVRGLETGRGCSLGLFGPSHSGNPCTVAAERTAPSVCSAPARPAAADFKPGIGVKGGICDGAFSASAGADWSAEFMSTSAVSPKPR